MFSNRKAEELHEVAVMRLLRGQQATADYFRVRIDQRLDATFDDWDNAASEEEPSQAAQARPGSRESVLRGDSSERERARDNLLAAS